MKPKVLCVIPISKKSLFNHEKIGKKELFWLTLDSAMKSKLIDKIVVCSDDLKIKKKIKHKNIIFLDRPKRLSEKDVSGEDVVNYAVQTFEEKDELYEIIIFLEITHPFRKKGLLDEMINTFLKKDLDTLFTAYEDKSSFWRFKEGQYKRIDEDYKRRKFREPIYKELKGLGCVTKRMFLREKGFFGEKIAIIPVRNLSALVDIKSEDDLWLARAFYNKK